ncbi:tumor necrosis factor receptor superfamily member 10C [Biomphalaria pfeifferi]|uniref:Tumor necrosis factor receptor superfamily member 10C n=1 Tax=Biomphalaria pfeifferi TaxID=112525 RepID=A0AAD8FIN6_BIOPF|nr:tumor necrosis factor receptor superfamily member 10C [Biomphalaria pfeifferi]
MNTLPIVLACSLVVPAYQQVLPDLNCPKGSFRDNRTNSFQICTPAPEDINSIQVYACNTTHDAKYICKEGFFNADGAGQLVCQRCRSCEDLGLSVAKNCSAEQDAVCCSDEIVSEASSETAPTTAASSQNSTTFQNRTSSVDTIVTDKQTTNTAVTGLTCGRNTRLDTETNSCKQCDLCSYVDHDLHSQQTCDPCSEGTNYSNLVYCPKKCFIEEPSVAKVVISILLGTLSPFLCIPIAILIIPLINKSYKCHQ